MTNIGDQLRKLAEEADSWPDLTAYACVVTKETALRSFTEFIEREQDARRAALMLLIELVRN